jgi:hypothetical protein
MHVRRQCLWLWCTNHAGGVPGWCLEGSCMRGVIGHLVFGALAVVIFPALCFAQFGAIAGVVKDSTGAVLPGVTVEAASPALIEKSRTAVSDSAGQYKVEQLRPGV